MAFGQWSGKNERAVGAEARKRARAKKKGCGPVARVLLLPVFALTALTVWVTVRYLVAG